MPLWLAIPAVLAAYWLGRRSAPAGPEAPMILPADSPALGRGSLVGIFSRVGSAPGGGLLPGGTPPDSEVEAAAAGDTRNGAVLSLDAF